MSARCSGPENPWLQPIAVRKDMTRPVTDSLATVAKKDLNFSAWMKALEAAAMISFWLFWVCPHSIDHDDHYLRAACPWGPGHRHERGDKCFRATHEKESCSQSLVISPERHQGLHPNSNARVQTVQTSHSSHPRYQVTVVASVELRLSQNFPRSSAHSSDF
jgi:hypothetical protein